VREDGPSQGALERDGDSLVLGCAQGGLELLELQPPGGRRMAVADWLRGLRGELPAVTPA
jgi:methionyl-tRNA formyltransferase